MPEFERIAVLGFGTMGAGIAYVAARAGATVTVLETTPERVEAGLARLSELRAPGGEGDKQSDAERTRALAQVGGTTEIADLADAELVIESVSEIAELKKQLLASVAAVVSAETVITSNTSSLSVTELGTSVTDPSRFAGLHFFDPVLEVGVVEVITAQQTAEAVVDRLSAFASQIGKEPLRVKGRPGFLINRLLMPYLNDVIQAYDDELASAEDIDVAIKLGLGYKVGPFEMLDRIGLDVHQAATRAVYEATLDPVYAPPPLLQTMVAAGMLGRRNGRGFRMNQEQQ